MRFCHSSDVGPSYLVSGAYGAGRTVLAHSFSLDHGKSLRQSLPSMTLEVSLMGSPVSSVGPRSCPPSNQNVGFGVRSSGMPDGKVLFQTSFPGVNQSNTKSAR